MDEKMTPNLNENPTEGQTGAPELTWQNEQDTAQAATETAQETVQTVAETAVETAQAATEAVTEAAEQTAETAEQAAQETATALGTAAETAAQTAQDTVAEVADGFSAPEASDVAVIKPKKPVGLLVAIGVLVVAIVAVIGVMLMQPPEKTVHTALDKTYSALMARGEKAMQAMPALGELNAPAKAAKGNFSFTFEGLEVADGGTEIAMVSNLLKGIGLRGNMVTDPANSLLELDANVGLPETPLVDFYMLMNPDTFAFGMPMCTETMFSIVPSTLKDDFKSSPLYTNMLETYEQFSPEYKDNFVQSMDTQMEMLQNILAAQIESLKTMGNSMELGKKMQSEMMTRIDTIYTGAVYKKLPKDAGMKVYQVDLQGAQVRQTIIDLAKYIYLDSELMNSYNNMFTPEMLGGQSYKDLMQQELIQPLEENLPELPTTLVIKMDGKKIIRSLHVTVNLPENQEGEDFQLQKLLGEFTYGTDETVGVTIDCEAVDTVLQEPLALQMDVKETFTGDASDTTIKYKMLMGAQESMNMDMLMAADKEGKLNVTMSMDIRNEYMPAMKLLLAMDGGMKKDGDKTVWEYPSIIGSIEEADAAGASKQLGSVTFAYRAETTPLTEAFAPARPTQEIFKMSVEALEAEMTKYQAKLNEIMQQFSSMFGGAAASPEIASVAPEDLPQDTAPAEDQLTPEQNAKLEAYFSNMTDEDFEAFMNMSEEEMDALMQEIISQPAA